MDGVYTKEPHLNHTLGIGSENITDLTLCLRFNVNFLKGITSYLISYSNIITDNSLVFEIQYGKSTTSKLFINTCKYGYITKGTGLCTNYVMGNWV